MFFFRLNFKAISFEGIEVIFRRMNANPGLAGHHVVFRDEVECYMIFASNIDTDNFRQHLQEGNVEYTEPGDLPMGIKNSPPYKAFLSLIGRG